MDDDTHVGTDHCRVVPPADGEGTLPSIQFARHLFAYAEAVRFIPAQSRVLEIGAGEGYGASHLASHVSRLVATDLSPRSSAHAASTYRGIRCCVALATGLPFAAAVFDAVVAFQVVEHIQDVARCMQEISRVLVPGGLVILTTPNRKLRLLPLQRPWNPYHVREYSATQMRRTLRPSFDHVQVYGITATPDILNLEKARVAQDPLRFYYRAARARLMRRLPQLLLQCLPHQLPKVLQKQRRRADHQVPVGQVGLDDFSLTLHADSAMDLFVVAKRRDHNERR